MGAPVWPLDETMFYPEAEVVVTATPAKQSAIADLLTSLAEDELVLIGEVTDSCQWQQTLTQGEFTSITEQVFLMGDPGITHEVLEGRLAAIEANNDEWFNVVWEPYNDAYLLVLKGFSSETVMDGTGSVIEETREELDETMPFMAVAIIDGHLFVTLSEGSTEGNLEVDPAEIEQRMREFNERSMQILEDLPRLTREHLLMLIDRIASS